MKQAPAGLQDRPPQQDAMPAFVERLDEGFKVRPGSLTARDSAHLQDGPGLRVSKILVAVDFSPATAKVLDSAVRMANQFKARVTLLHVIDINKQAGSGSAEDLMRDLWAKGSEQIGRLSSKVDAQAMLEEGLPWEVIVEKSHDFDLLVLGQNPGRKSWKLFSRQTTKRVIENSECSVMVVANRN